MVLDARRRQKKKERRHAKQKAKKQDLAKRTLSISAAKIERAASAPILHCCATELLWDQGMGSVLLSRELPNRRVAFGVFLVDAYCLGVKDAWSNLVPRSEYEQRVLGPIFEEHGLVETTPEFARKVVEGAVDYAWSLGFPPHPDYRAARLIFGRIDAGACTEAFTYGKDGKPFFIAGPKDSPWRCREVINQLTRQCGPDGCYYTVPLAELDEEIEFDDDDILILSPSSGLSREDDLSAGSLARLYLRYMADQEDDEVLQPPPERDAASKPRPISGFARRLIGRPPRP